MLLFHGTSSEHLISIKSKGLIPRHGNGNWTVNSQGNNIVSKPGFVYLTCAYPGYFANAAVGESENYEMIVVMVDVDERLLFPDEDYIYECSKFWNIKDGCPVLQSEDVDLFYFKDVWKDSLYNNGFVAHLGPIPPNKILDIKALSFRDFIDLGGDTVPTPMGFAFTGYKYVTNTLGFFGMSLNDFPEKRLFSWYSQIELFQEMNKRPEEMNQKILKRHGVSLETVTLGELLESMNESEMAEI